MFCKTQVPLKKMFRYGNKTHILIRVNDHHFFALSFSYEESESERQQHSRVECTEQRELQHGALDEFCDCAERTTGSDAVSRDAESATPPAPTAETPRLRRHWLGWWEITQVLFFLRSCLLAQTHKMSCSFTLTDHGMREFCSGFQKRLYPIPNWVVPGAVSVTVGVNELLQIGGIGCIALSFTIIFANRGRSHKIYYWSRNQSLIHLPCS